MNLIERVERGMTTAEDAEIVREWKEALEFVAASTDAGRHDGHPESCPANDDIMMWWRANEALELESGGVNDES